MSETVTMTVAQATVKFLSAQYSESDGVEQKLFAGCLGIFGHGNIAGLGQALALERSGARDVVLLEKAPASAGVGGTWRDNTYPGCACDIPSHMYSLSTDPNPDWSRSDSPPMTPGKFT